MSNVHKSLNDAIKGAMLAKDRARLQVLRTISASFKQIEVDKRIEITDEIAIAELARLSKMRKDSIEIFTEAQRQDLVEKEEFELAIIQELLPKQLSNEEINTIISDIFIENSFAKNTSSVGPMMNILRTQLLGQADMKIVNQLLMQFLNN